MNPILLIIILLGLSTSVLRSQKPELLPPLGHNIFSTDFDISPVDNTIVTVSIDRQMIFWDIRSQKAFFKIKAHEAEIYSVKYSWSGKYIVTSSFDGSAKVWNAEGTLFREFKTDISVTHADIDREEKRIAFSSVNGHIYIADIETGKVLSEIEAHASRANFAVFSTNGNLIFSGDDEGNLRAFEISNNNKRLLDLKLEAAVKLVTFDNSGSAMVIHTMDGLAEVLLLPNFQSIGRITIPTKTALGGVSFCSVLDISPDSQWLAFSNADGKIQIANGEVMVKNALEGKPFMTTVLMLPQNEFIGRVRFSQDMAYLVGMSMDKTLYVAEIAGRDLSKTENEYIGVKRLRMHSDYPKSIFFDNNKNLNIRGLYTYKWNLESGSYQHEWIVSTRDAFLRQSLDSIHGSGLKLFIDRDRDIVLFEKNHKLHDPYHYVWSHDRQTLLINDSLQYYVVNTAKKTIKSPVPFSWNKDDIITTDTNGFIYMAKGTVLQKLDEKGKQLWQFNGKYKISSISIHPSGEQLVAGTFGKECYLIESKNGKTDKIATGEAEMESVLFTNAGNSFIYAGIDGDIGLYLISNKKRKVLDRMKSGVKHMALDNSDNLLGVISYARTAEVYDLKKMNKLWDIHCLQEYGIAITNKEGYYMSDKKAYQELAFKYSNRIFTGDQFDAEYNRPDLILAASPYAEGKMVNLLKFARDKRLKKLYGENGDALASVPQVKITNLSDLKTIELANKTNIEISVTDTVHNLKALHISVNDVPTYGRQGLDLSNKTSGQLTLKQEIPLLNGANTITITAENLAGGVALSQSLQIESHALNKPELYFVGIGTSEYAQEKHNLKYPTKDIMDVKQLLSKSSLYSKVHTLTLINKDVQPDAPEKISDFLQSARPEDIVLVFIAGHGLLDSDFNYFLATHRTNFNNPAEGSLAYQSLENILDKSKSLRKVMLVDACHSGEVDKDDLAFIQEQNTEQDSDLLFRNVGAGVTENAAGLLATTRLMNELFADLRQGTGSTVLSSSGGAEYSMEGDRWQNGLFTYSFLQGIESGSADLDGDGAIMLSEIRDFVQMKVYTLSSGKQQPTARSENLTNDFRIW
jgi:WD40 repeat protein